MVKSYPKYNILMKRESGFESTRTKMKFSKCGQYIVVGSLFCGLFMPLVAKQITLLWFKFSEKNLEYSKEDLEISGVI